MRGSSLNSGSKAGTGLDSPLDRRHRVAQLPSSLVIEAGGIWGFVLVGPTTLFFRNSEVTLFHRCEQGSRVSLVLGCYQDLNPTEPIEGQAVGLAERFSAGRRRDSVSIQKRAHLRLFWLTLRGVDDDPMVFHFKER